VANGVGETDHGRFLFYEKHFRSNKTIKSDAFVPHPQADLSVTELRTRPNQRLTHIGRLVGQLRGRELLGRADFMSERVTFPLAINPDPTDIDEHHRVIEGWPADKSEQKLRAMMIASSAVFVENEDSAE